MADLLISLWSPRIKWLEGFGSILNQQPCPNSLYKDVED